MKRLVFTILGVLIFCGLSAQEIPQKISYQGKLLENGIPVTGTKNITFTIDSWSESKSVSVTDGLYSVTLGETTPIPTSIFDNSSSVSLEITIAGTTLSSQTDILSVAYAYKAEKAVDTEKIAGNPVTGNPTTDKVLKWNGTSWTPQDDGLNLPYYGTYNGSSILFEIENNGTGKAMQITNSTSGSHALKIINNSNIEAFELNDYGSNEGMVIRKHNQVGRCAEFRITNSNNASHVLYASSLGTGKAGYFNGDVEVTGTINKGAVGFKIDHPLVPENKFLYHSCIESPDMMNVYNGNIILDNNGVAIVELPEWFDVLNKDFRYQLTCIGGFAPVYIAEKISGNSFKIAGGTSGMEVSWQITGIRQDPYANQNRIQVEVDKSEKEKGNFLHYKEYNQPLDKSIEAVKNPEILEKLNK